MELVAISRYIARAGPVAIPRYKAKAGPAVAILCYTAGRAVLEVLEVVKVKAKEEDIKEYIKILIYYYYMILLRLLNSKTDRT